MTRSNGSAGGRVATGGRADDQAARDRITADLDTSMLVEAGAGSGKTTKLVDRMLALVARGTPVERIAAVTFTRKAANELRERFQIELEKRVREESDAGLRARFDVALRELDRAFLGTIHSFCARLLRERPLEVGLDPRFQEITEEDWAQLQLRFWRRWVDRAKRADDPAIVELARLGVDPLGLSDGFARVVAYPDVDFPLGDAPEPDGEPCRKELERLLAKARKMMPHDEPEGGWDDLMQLIRRLEFHRRTHDWRDTRFLCAAIERIVASHCKATQKQWSDTKEGKAAAKELSESFVALLEGPVADLLRCWREHRYPVVMRFLRRAAEEFERERHAMAQLSFEDLLLLAAKLLRENPGARDELGARYAYLLVDEFQDTDPIQAEVCFLLASDASEGTDWRTVVPRPGALFVVGDPKQSIYRFRRADIQIYEIVKRRMHAVGAVLSLTRNFRSVDALERLVNGHFRGIFPEAATAEQAPFSEMQTVHAAGARDGTFEYVVPGPSRGTKAIIEQDAAMLASWIAARIASGERSAGDFLILTERKAPIEAYARALGERNIPVTTTGAPLPQERELREMVIVLRALADPENAVAIAAALEGLFFGLSPADLFEGRQAGLRFSIAHPPADAGTAMGRALATLHEWWKASQRQAADVVLERIIGETGLLFHAAGEPLGDARAGALLHLVEALRTASLAGAPGMTDAMERIEVLLTAEAADAPLRPGRTDAVRVMNLHKAKGLEAEVVILAAPVANDPKPATAHVQREDGRRATGGLLIEWREPESRRGALVIAQPPGWEAMQQKEAGFLDAERARLLYVAATRARRELVVARCERMLKSGPKPEASFWSPLAPTLASLGATTLELEVAEAPGRRPVTRPLESIVAAREQAVQRVHDAAQATVHVQTVTAAAKSTFDAPAPDGSSSRGAESRGAAWGRAVHRGIEALGRGRRGDALRAFLAAVARDERLDPHDRDALERTIAEIERSAAWGQLAAAREVGWELTVVQRTLDGAHEVLTEGVVDVAARGAEGWTVLDWKTDGVEGAAWAGRERAYTDQVERYGAMLAALTGEHVKAASVERVRRG